MINGETNEPFQAAKGLRQGDLISLFLFAMAMKYLSRQLNTLEGSWSFSHHPRCVKLAITHLCFADDLLLFARGDL